MRNIQTRSQVRDHPALGEGFGTSRTWQRTISGRHYSFTAILMPDGERRYSASVLRNGKDSRFDSSWKRVGFWTCPVSWLEA